jgi:hypothetical protein
MRSDRLLLAALVGLGVSAAGSAQAYSLLFWDWSWQNNPMSDPFYINVGSFPSSVGQTANVRSALEGGINRWGNEGDADLSFNYAGTTNQTSFGGGGLHIAQWNTGAVSGATLAVAQSSGFGDNMTDCDIRFYRANGFGVIDWSSNPSGASFNELDLEYVAVHEFGHCAGLDHSSNFNAVMYGAASSGTGPAARALSADDRNGLQALYDAAVGGDIEMSVLDPIVAGTSVNVQVTGADTNDLVRLAVSTVGEGNGPCFAALGGRCADILPPIAQADTDRANSAGVADLVWNIPASYDGFTIGLQAVVIKGPGGADTLMSNTVGATVLAAGTSCAAGSVPDCDGNCWNDTWPGDGYCDDGTLYQWGDPNFNCSLFNFDEGDCN